MNIYSSWYAFVYILKFQKRGLHMFISYNGSTVTLGTCIYEVISVELPDKKLNPGLYSVVSDYMAHGPCGTLNTTSPCMHDGKKMLKKVSKAIQRAHVWTNPEVVNYFV